MNRYILYSYTKLAYVAVAQAILHKPFYKVYHDCITNDRFMTTVTLFIR